MRKVSWWRTEVFDFQYLGPRVLTHRRNSACGTSQEISNLSHLQIPVVVLFASASRQ